MITSNHIVRLLETYFNYITVYKNKIPIYKNPGSSDYHEMNKLAKDDGRSLKEIKFMAYAPDKSVYVADSYNVEHLNIINAIGKPYQLGKFMGGICLYQNGHFQVTSLRSNTVYYSDGLLEKFGFLEKYFSNIVSFIKSLPKA